MNFITFMYLTFRAYLVLDRVTSYIGITYIKFDFHTKDLPKACLIIVWWQVVRVYHAIKTNMMYQTKMTYNSFGNNFEKE